MSDGAELNGATQAAVTGGAGAAPAAPASPEAAALQSAALQAAAMQAAALQSAAVASAPPVQLAAAAATAAVPFVQATASAAPESGKEATPEPKKKARTRDDARDKKDEEAAVLTEEEDLSGQIENFFAEAAQSTSGTAASGAEVESDDDDDGGIPTAVLIGAGVLAVVGIGVLVLGGGDKNSPPVAAPDTGAVNEGASLTGSVATNDSDKDGDALTYSLVGTAPAGFTLNPNGSYTFDAANAAYNGLAAGATQQVVVNYSVSDGEDSATSTLTITVTGTNDAPTAAAVTGPAATEGGAAVTATVVGADPDQGAVLTYSLVNPPAGVTINATTGVVTLNPADAAYNALAAGQTQQVVANVRVTDAQGAFANTTVTFTVTGTNDAPVVTAQTGPAATEGGAAVTGTFAATDPEGQALTFALVEPVAGLTINATTGAYSLNPADPAYNNLAAGETRNVVANVRVTDSQNLSTTQTLTFVVTGTNDVPVAVADTGNVNEDASITGNVRTNDIEPDNGDTLTYTIVGTAPAGLTLNADGSYTFNAANPAYQDLGAGATRVITVNLQVTDGKSPPVNTTLTLTVTGTNDLPVVTADVAAGAEDTTISGNLRSNDVDVDVGDTLTYTLVGNAPAGFVLNADGTYSLDASNEAYRLLREGETQTITVNYTATDGKSAPIASTLTITLTGRVEQVNLDVDTDDNLLTARIFNSGDTDYSFSDDDDVANTVIINNFGADDFITFDAPFNGQGSVSFANIDFDNDGLANDLSITTNKGGNVSEIVLRNVVDANAVIFNEASAEAAIGADFQNFRTTTQVTVVNQSLDVDNDNNLNSRFVVAPSANTATFVYTDDDDAANTVRVNDFGADDTLIFDAAVSSVSFASIDADGDGLANDLAITVNKNGLVSDIILANSIDPNAIIFNEAQAEAAIGAGTDNFQFSIAVPPPPPPPPVGETSQGLDQDTDNNLNTYRVFDAGTGGFTFRDDADIANSVQIINLGSNDRIVLEAGVDYSFANIDFDGDGLANDLQVIANKGGTVSDIILKDAVDPNAVVFSESTAEQALGNIDYFSFA